MEYDDLELLQMHVDALFIHDGHQRLVCTNEPDPAGPAPRFFLGRSAKGNVWRVRHDVPDGLAAKLGRLAAAEPILMDGTYQAPLYRATYVELLEQDTPVGPVEAGPAYYLPEMDSACRAVLITPQNKGLLQAHFPCLLSALEACSLVAVMVAADRAVAACHCARLTERVAEAGVYTVEAYRGQGYAIEVVQCWASAVRASGRLALYSTSWDNTASQRVAQKLGAVLYGEDFSLT